MEEIKNKVEYCLNCPAKPCSIKGCPLNNNIPKFIETVKNDYQNLYFINEIMYWLNPDNRRGELVNSHRYEKIKSLYNNMLNEIKRKKINMYSSQYYNRYNMVLLFDDEKYMSSIKINRQNLMLFIVDCISLSTGSSIGYNFNIQYLDKFYGWNKVKNDIAKCPNSELKKFLVNAIENLELCENAEDKYTYYTDEWVDLNELIMKYLNRSLTFKE